MNFLETGTFIMFCQPGGMVYACVPARRDVLPENRKHDTQLRREAYPKAQDVP